MQAQQRKLVLVAQDDRQVLERAAAELRRSGYGVLEASDALEAVELSLKHGPDLAVVDVAIPAGGSRGLDAPVIQLVGIDRLCDRVADALAA